MPCPGGSRHRPPLRLRQSLHRARHFLRSLRITLLRPHPGRPRATARASLPGTAAARNSAADNIAHIEEQRRRELQQEAKLRCNRRSRTEPFQLRAASYSIKHVMAPAREGQWPSGAALATQASIGFVHLFQSFAARTIADSKKGEACSRELLHRIGFSTWLGSPRSCRSSNAVNPI